MTASCITISVYESSIQSGWLTALQKKGGNHRAKWKMIAFSITPVTTTPYRSYTSSSFGSKGQTQYSGGIIINFKLTILQLWWSDVKHEWPVRSRSAVWREDHHNTNWSADILVLYLWTCDLLSVPQTGWFGAWTQNAASWNVCGSRGLKSSRFIWLSCSDGVASPSDWLLNPDCSIRDPEASGPHTSMRWWGEPSGEMWRGTSQRSSGSSSLWKAPWRCIESSLQTEHHV